MHEPGDQPSPRQSWLQTVKALIAVELTADTQVEGAEAKEKMDDAEGSAMNDGEASKAACKDGIDLTGTCYEGKDCERRVQAGWARP